MAAPEPNLTIPMKLDAFVFNESVCEGEPHDAKISPITQPNYTFLQLKDSLIQHDILEHVDLHNAIPKETNPRLNDLGTSEVRENRLGVYLHWVLPRFYRMGAAATPSAAKDHTEQRRERGLHASASANPDYTAPEFPRVPNRWLVIRSLDPHASTTVPRDAPIQAVEAWVIESDRLRSIEDEELDDADLQVDISPYIKANTEDIDLGEQAEAFIGYKESAATWGKRKDNGRKEYVNLTAVSSSNQLFVDYQPHCSNVFSTLDPFEYRVDGDSTPKKLTKAVANYYVIGWHADSTQGPFGSLKENQTRRDRLNTLPLSFNGDAQPPDVKRWLDSMQPGEILCHGAIYNVTWDRSSRPAHMPSDAASNILTGSMPVTVGTTPIDALLAYVEKHQESDLEKDLKLIAPLLRAQDEGVDAHRAASDEVQNWNFARESGGQHWYFQSSDKQEVKEPSDEDVDKLEKLNQAQRLLDSTKRQIEILRWEMFSLWWQYVSAPDTDRPRPDVEGLQERFEGLQKIARKQTGNVERLLDKLSERPQNGVMAEFYQSRDPTLLVGGIRAGWPDDYLEKLKVRLDTQLVPSKTPIDLTPYCTGVLPESLQKTAQGLIQEFVALDTANPEDLPPGHYLPLYHDRGLHGTESDPLRDQWSDTQPWAPLFLEWQAEYFHIPWKEDQEDGKEKRYWELFGKDGEGHEDKLWRFGIAPDVNLGQYKADDSRTLSGRVLLLPQPSFSLQAAIDQLFSSIDPETLKKKLPDEKQRERIKNDSYKLPFLSSPLAGFTDHLLTLAQGTHIKPLARFPGKEGLNPIQDAKTGPFQDKDLKMIDRHSELTPYGSMVQFARPVQESEPDTGEESQLHPNPFKPATHGQFRFLKLNIVDKFGQAISAIDPRYGHEEDEAIYPLLSQYYAPQTLANDPDQPNVVHPPGRDQKSYCEFVQVPPAINQPARLNSAFMMHDTRYDKNGPREYSYWRPATEWENPIWGWIVLNYVDYGIQLFLPDGTFYREVRLASPGSQQHTSASAKWLPFAPPAERPKTQQLDHLIDKLVEEDQKYLNAFLGMANQSLEKGTTAPSAYAGFLNSLVGRPLALVNAGWSLELSTDAKKPQAKTGSDIEQEPRMKLRGVQDNSKDVYRFPLKLGDKDRTSDGLVGYWNTSESPNPGNELDLSKIYTYYTSNDSSGTLHDITKDNLPHFESFWLNPDDYSVYQEKSAQQFTKDWNNRLQVFGTIIDPFLPINAYSSILPINGLQLLPWMWQQAMQKMTAFFHMGPIVVTDDVQPYYDEGKRLTGNYQLSPPEKDQTVPRSAVVLPSLQSGNWAWLQPFVDPSDTEFYNALALGKTDNRPRYQQGPYTAVEGYLQLKEPIVRPGTEKRKT